MNTSEVEHNSEALYELASVCAASDATIAGYVSLCESLWKDPQSRIWLVAALMRKASFLTLEPDQACLEFLADKVAEDLDLFGEGIGPSREQLVENLPTIIQLMPDQVWHRPSSLWHALLQALMEEYRLERDIERPPGAEIATVRVVELASFLADGIGADWDDDLNKRLESWKNRPEYTWLTALRDSARLDVLVDSIRKEAADEFPLNAPDLFEKFIEMRPPDKRRFLTVLDSATSKTFWPEIDIDNVAQTIDWKFDIELNRQSRVKLCLRDRTISEIKISEEPDGGVVINTATGICAPLRTKHGEKLTVKKAAAGKLSRLARLTPTVRGGVRPLGGGQVLFVIEWHAQGS